MRKLTRKIFDYKGNDLGQFINKTIVLGTDSMPYKITGICKNVPENSHLRFEMLKSYQTLISTYHWKEADYDFTDSDFWHYIRLKKELITKNWKQNLRLQPTTFPGQ